jgi:hypothetical protein
MPAKLPPGQLTKKQRRALRRKPRKSGRATVKNSNTSAKAQNRLENIALVLELRRSGYTFEQIGKQIGVHLTTARDMWLDGIDAVVHEPAEKLLAMELDRLDEMQASIYAKAARVIKQPSSACSGSWISAPGFSGSIPTASARRGKIQISRQRLLVRPFRHPRLIGRS